MVYIVLYYYYLIMSSHLTISPKFKYSSQQLEGWAFNKESTTTLIFNDEENPQENKPIKAKRNGRIKAFNQTLYPSHNFHDHLKNKGEHPNT